MSETPEEIRARIDRTRESVSNDVDALAEKVSPSSIVGRETERVKGKVNAVKDRLFGSDDQDPGVVGQAGQDVRGAVGHAGDSVRGAVGNVGEGVRHTADRAAEKAKGNPLAMGLIAFGVGALISSLIPASSVEKDAASKVKDAAQPLMDEVKDVAKEAGEHLKEPAQEAAQTLKDSAQTAGQNIKGEAQAAAADVKDEAQSAAGDVKSEAQDASQRVKDEHQS